MSYRETAKLSNLSGGQDGRKGDYHVKAEGIKETACDSPGIGKIDNTVKGSRGFWVKRKANKADSAEDKRGRK